MNADPLHTPSPRWISALEADRAAGRKGLAVLVDPDHACTSNDLAWMADPAFSAVHTVLLGGSLVTEGSMDHTATLIRERTDRPIVLFPGAPSQLTAEADALLFLSVISGRNLKRSSGNMLKPRPASANWALTPSAAATC